MDPRLNEFPPCCGTAGRHIWTFRLFKMRLVLAEETGFPTAAITAAWTTDRGERASERRYQPLIARRQHNSIVDRAGCCVNECVCSSERRSRGDRYDSMVSPSAPSDARSLSAKASNEAAGIPVCECSMSTEAWSS